MEKFKKYFELLSTTALGVVGTLTGNLSVQIIAFFPAVLCQMISDLNNNTDLDSLICGDVQKLIKEACDFTEMKLSKNSLRKLWISSRSRIEKCLDRPVPIEELKKELKRNLNFELYGEFDYITHNDLSSVVETFVETASLLLPKYPRLSDCLSGIVLVNHENRISLLEKIIDAYNGQFFEAEEINPFEFKRNDIYDDTQYYSEKLDEPLFLHRRLPKEERITLNDLYVIPGANVISGYKWYENIKKLHQMETRSGMDYSYINITDAVKEFIDYTPKQPGDQDVNILFIEGKAAIGKSSFISWLCRNYSHIDFFNKYKLITIKLRDIPYSKNEVLNIKFPFLQICSYLLKREEKKLSSGKYWLNISKMIFSNTILILEGFDELCMIEGILGDGKEYYFQNLYNELIDMDCNCKIIVTSRPEYLNVEALDFPKAHISISPFTVLQRKRWIQKYESIQSISNELKRNLFSEGSMNLDGIIDSPLTLYMIVARNINISNNSNLWYIYNEIFANGLYKREYETGAPHAINLYRDLLFRLTAEISNAVSHEQHLNITVQKMLDRKEIRNLFNRIEECEKKEVQEILADCFGLASYFRISTKMDDTGKLISAVEFYHNNIKDYFYCEYIWMNLEKIYLHAPKEFHEKDEWFIKSFQNLFQYSACLKDSSEGIRAKPIDFLESKIRYLKENNIPIDFICQELKQRNFKHFFGKMLRTGFLYNYKYTKKDNIIQMILCIYSSVLSIYHTLYLPYLENNEHFALTDNNSIADNEINFMYRILFSLSNIHDLTNMEFDGVVLSEIEFININFQNSSFRKCLLIGCSFKGCNLRGADFSAASLKNADFRNAIIDETTVFSKTTEFGYTKIRWSQLPYFAPWINEDLIYSDSEAVTYIAPTNSI